MNIEAQHSTNGHPHNFCPPWSCPFCFLPPWLGDGCEGGEGMGGLAGSRRWGLIREIRSGGSDSHYNSSSDLTVNVLHPAHLIQFTSIIFSLFVLAPPSVPSLTAECHPLFFFSFHFFLHIFGWGGEFVQIWPEVKRWWKIWPFLSPPVPSNSCFYHEHINQWDLMIHLAWIMSAAMWSHLANSWFCITL